MIQLKNLCKTYRVGDTAVRALRDVSLKFKKGEFVSILGPSGCGKTTLLNLIGGLDRYDSGDIIINGKSTKDFKAKDWDTYRNHSIGFVFQSYNLIGHQSVLANVELALTVAGVSRSERRQRAKEALRRVGLENELRKKPNQLSGGQMQRVAIARALINDPEILLADEPTGALDSETSVQVMELLKEIAKDRLVIMVTHNGELAEQYSTRIIRLSDGAVTDDSSPCTEDDSTAGQDAKKHKKRSMSFLTAFMLSLTNLLTKKGRTVLTSFAGSIGIIGIALILSLSSGFQAYIDRAQEETLSTYPLTINKTTMDGSLMLTVTGETDTEPKDSDHIYADSRLSEMFNALQSGMHTNDLKSLKEFIDSDDSKIKDSATVQYKYNLNLDFYLPDTSDGAVKASSAEIIDRMYEVMVGQTYTEMLEGVSGMMGGLSDSMSTGVNMWSELMDNQQLLDQQYSLVKGHWPENYNEVVLAVDTDSNGNARINDMYLYALGLKPRSEFEENLQKMKNGETLPVEHSSYTLDEILSLKFKLVLNCDKYQKENGVWVDKSSDPEAFKKIVDDAMEIKVVGIIKPADGSVAQSLQGLLGYRSSLVNEVVERTENSAIVKEQRTSQNTDVFTGNPFAGEEMRENWDKMTTDEKWNSILPFMSQFMGGAFGTGTNPGTGTIPGTDPGTIPDIDSSIDPGTVPGADPGADPGTIPDIDSSIDPGTIPGADPGTDPGTIPGTVPGAPTEEEKEQFLNRYQEQINMIIDSLGSFDGNMEKLGAVDLESPQQINIYPVDFASKDVIKSEIERYNNEHADDEDKEIKYTDLLDLMLSTISTIIDAISYVLIAFVSISLVVSSIMIGVITYISVLERTKEIGILRAVGASKHDISRVFNAETFIVGLVAGVMGILITLLLNIPINAAINKFAEIGSIAALPPVGALILVCISVLLTVIAGLVPAKLAANRDPVVALRTE